MQSVQFQKDSTCRKTTFVYTGKIWWESICIAYKILISTFNLFTFPNCFASVISIYDTHLVQPAEVLVSNMDEYLALNWFDNSIENKTQTFFSRLTDRVGYFYMKIVTYYRETLLIIIFMP